MAIKGSQSEYNKLRKVILGRLDGNNLFPKDDLGMIAIIAADEKLHTPDGKLDLKKAADMIPEITAEIQETTAAELRQLYHFFKSEEVEIVHPDPVPKDQKVVTQSFETTQFPVYCPRDVIFNFRELIVVSPNLYRSRIHESNYYTEILNDEREKGRVVIHAPRPQLHEKHFNLDAKSDYILNTTQPVFEAANTLIDGEHNAIYYQVSHSGNLAGYEWLKSLISNFYPEVTVYPLEVYKGSHLDTTIAILSHDTVALNPERITNPDDLPGPLKKRKHIFPDIIEVRNKEALSSKWIGMNSLSVRPDLIVVDSDQVKYINQLEESGFDVFPHKLTYSDIVEGGHHCTTSDLLREENY
jgi:glycine amidinotransferase